MLNLVQHLMKSMDYETLKRVQGDGLGVLGQPLCPYFSGNTNIITRSISESIWI